MSDISRKTQKRLDEYDIIVHKMASDVKVSKIRYTVTYPPCDMELNGNSTNEDVLLSDDENISVIAGLRFKLDDRCSLVFLEWPECITVPEFDSSAKYHEINVHGMKKQPRRTICYGQGYKYSGVKHQLEKNTPVEIENIMEYTKCMYSGTLQDESVKMMCLANKYSHKYHCIAQHHDKEGQFSSVTRSGET